MYMCPMRMNEIENFEHRSCACVFYLSGRCLWSKRWPLMLLCLRMLRLLHFRCGCVCSVLRLLFCRLLLAVCWFSVFHGLFVLFVSLANATANFSFRDFPAHQIIFHLHSLSFNVIHLIAVIRAPPLTPPFLQLFLLTLGLGFSYACIFSTTENLNNFMRSLSSLLSSELPF